MVIIGAKQILYRPPVCRYSILECIFGGVKVLLMVDNASRKGKRPDCRISPQGRILYDMKYIMCNLSTGALGPWVA